MCGCEAELRAELAKVKAELLHRQQQAHGVKGAYVFINERGQPFGRMGIGRMIERAGEAAGCRSRCMFTCCGIRPDTRWRGAGWIRAGFSITSGMPRSRIPCATPRCRRSRSRLSGADFNAGLLQPTQADQNVPRGGGSPCLPRRPFDPTVPSSNPHAKVRSASAPWDVQSWRGLRFRSTESVSCS